MSFGEILITLICFLLIALLVIGPHDKGGKR